MSAGLIPCPAVSGLQSLCIRVRAHGVREAQLTRHFLSPAQLSASEFPQLNCPTEVPKNVETIPHLKKS